MLIRILLFAAVAALALPAQQAARAVPAQRTQTIQAGGNAVWFGQAGEGPGPWVNMEAVTLPAPAVWIEGPPKTGAPYSAEAVTETVQTLADGNRIRHENRTSIYRDGQGRTRREEAINAVGPLATGGDEHKMIFINDPVAGAHWVIDPQEKTARKMPIPKMGEMPGVASISSFGRTIASSGGSSSGGSTSSNSSSSTTSQSSGIQVERNVSIQRDVTVARAVEAPGAPSQHHFVFNSLSASPVAGMAGAGDMTTEDLGERTIEGVVAKGTKQTRTIKAGQIGNDRPIEVVYESWESPELGVTVESRRSDPRVGVTTYKLTNVQRTEPLPTMFEPPADYEVVDSGALFERRMEMIEKKQQR
ncbi:MAG: hypothetical protein GC160_01495 [Acidobacteria bacterium]|nr:hypothetical protein [Acidobacteriota bacterium]